MPPLPLAGPCSLDDAVQSVFGADMLRRVHGDTLSGDCAFDAAGHRAFKFRVALQNVPAPIRRFFCGDSMGVTTRQELRRVADDTLHIRSRVKLHFVGSELFRLSPLFSLTRDAHTGRVTLGAAVRHDALLLPPLNRIAEHFMATNSEQKLMRLRECLVDTGVALPPPPPPQTQ